MRCDYDCNREMHSPILSSLSQAESETGRCPSSCLCRAYEANQMVAKMLVMTCRIIILAFVITFSVLVTLVHIEVKSNRRILYLIYLYN